MEAEVCQFERNQVWSLTPRLKNRPMIGTKWVFTNELDATVIEVRNKARLVSKEFDREGGIRNIL